MAKEKKVYTRRLSLDESKERYVLIPKDALSMFPAPGRPFPAKINGKEGELFVEAVPCTCRGLNKPHDHYHLSFAHAELGTNVRRGSVATVRKEGENYKIEIR